MRTLRPTRAQLLAALTFANGVWLVVLVALVLWITGVLDGWLR